MPSHPPRKGRLGRCGAAVWWRRCERAAERSREEMLEWGCWGQGVSGLVPEHGPRKCWAKTGRWPRGGVVLLVRGGVVGWRSQAFQGAKVGRQGEGLAGQ